MLFRSIFFAFGAEKGGHGRRPHRAHLLASVEVADDVLEDALKEHRQLGRRLAAVFFGQLEHRILHDVESEMIVADREQRLLVRAALDLREKIRKFLVRSQWLALS